MTTTMEKQNGNGLAVRAESAPALGLSGSVQIASLGQVFQLAERLAHAKGFVPRSLLGDPNAIAAAILTGIELNMGPMEAMRSVHMVDGKPTMSADLMLARAIRAGVRISWQRSDVSAATLRLERPGFGSHVQSYSIEEAKTAGLAGKDNWKKHPAAMLRARCVSAAMRAFCPDVLGSGVYAPDELDAPDETPMPAVVVTTEAAREPELAPREVEIDHGEIVEVPESFAACMTAEQLQAFCRDKRDALASLKNGQRKTAIDRALDAAGRCGVEEPLVLEWAGLSS